MTNNTTVWLTKEVKEHIASLKVHPRETYDDVLRRLLEREEKK